MRISPFKLERYFGRYEFTTQHLLSSSDCESMSIGELLALEPGAAEAMHDHWLGYTESAGHPELRAAIAEMYHKISPGHVLTFTGAEEAIFIFMNAMLRPGDHIIVHAPGYQSLYEVARAAGCDVELWLTDDASNWELDLDWLEDHIRPETRAIVVNCPHNPTGYQMSAETQRQIVEMARRRDIYLFSDEVYRGLEHSERPTLPAACDLYEKAISLGVLSKTYGLPGLRTGWVATRDTNVLAQMQQFKDYTTICSSAPSEFLSIVALKHHEALRARSLKIVRDNLALLDQFFAHHSDHLSWVRPQASSIAFPRLAGGASAEQFCQEIMARSQVLLVPASCFNYGDQHFRLGYGRRSLPEALDHLEAFLQAQPAGRR